jgi:3,4-dihydroxy 2-butanone 4-phosphate synthase/GTP cyclohydrolase II
MERIAAAGRGVILYLRRSGRGLDLFDIPEGASRQAPSTGFASPRASIFRDFGIGAQILRDIGVRKIRWLTNNPLRLVSLPGYGLEIVEWVPLSDAPGARQGDPGHSPGQSGGQSATQSPSQSPTQSKVIPLR